MKSISSRFIITITALLLCLAIVLSLVIGEYEIGFLESVKALFGLGTNEDINIIQKVRLPRVVVGLICGATLALSGIFIKAALKNPLADSGILGIQTGSTTFALIIILLFPGLYSVLPFFAFFGGMLAFLMTIFISYKNKVNTTTLVLAGVAVNAFFTAIIGMLTILNQTKLQSALTYLNGSLANITVNEMNYVLIYGVLAIIGSLFYIPILNILRLNDNTICNLGKSPDKYKIYTAIYGVLLASITVSFVGVIGFVGIIIPSIAKQLVGSSIKLLMTESMLLGSLFIVSCDLFQRIIFAPLEIPVGLIVGLISAPIFLSLIRRSND